MAEGGDAEIEIVAVVESAVPALFVTRTQDPEVAVNDGVVKLDEAAPPIGDAVVRSSPNTTEMPAAPSCPPRRTTWRSVLPKSSDAAGGR